jgi:hypothetical protein
MRNFMRFVWSEIRPRVSQWGGIAGRDAEDEWAMELIAPALNLVYPPVEVLGRFVWLVMRALAALVRAIAHRPANAAS